MLHVIPETEPAIDIVEAVPAAVTPTTITHHIFLYVKYMSIPKNATMQIGTTINTPMA
jgi:hypothetical protein